MTSRPPSTRQPLLWLACGALGLAWVLLLAAAVRPVGVSWRWPFDPAEDGAWQAVSLDGQRVSTSVRYAVDVRDHEVRSGYDGCNSWGFLDDAPKPNGDRMLTSDLAGCSPLPLQTTYRALAFGQPRLELVDGDTLRLEAQGHVGVFRRVELRD